MPRVIQVKSILNKTKRRDPWFLDDYTINPYSGCSFNCLFCYIRGSKYGINMEEKLSVKENALELLDKQLALRAKKKQYGIIVLSSVTDPYLPIEKQQKLTRGMLEIILKYKFPVHIITRSDLVIRDFDLLQQIRENAILPDDLNPETTDKVFITFSFTSTDSHIAKIFEPGAASPAIRLNALKQASEAGFTTGISLMPLLPYISDTGKHLEEMFMLFQEHKAHYIFPASLTLFGTDPYDSKALIFDAIQKYYPELLERYRNYFKGNSTSVPKYYHDALAKKTDELCEKYRLRKRLQVKDYR